MSTLAVKVDPLAVNIHFSPESVFVFLADGREISAPLEWFPKLRDATESQKEQWELIGDGIGIHWPEIDEDIETESLLSIN